jgi:hypothetical protein
MEEPAVRISQDEADSSTPKANKRMSVPASTTEQNEMTYKPSDYFSGVIYPSLLKVKNDNMQDQTVLKCLNRVYQSLEELDSLNQDHIRQFVHLMHESYEKYII